MLNADFSAAEDLKLNTWKHWFTRHNILLADFRNKYWYISLLNKQGMFRKLNIVKLKSNSLTFSNYILVWNLFLFFETFKCLTNYKIIYLIRINLNHTRTLLCVTYRFNVYSTCTWIYQNNIYYIIIIFFMGYIPRTLNLYIGATGFSVH